MKNSNKLTQKIYMVSGGSGASGMQMLNTALAQFPGCFVEIVKNPHVRSINTINRIFQKASKDGSPIVHTLVNSDLRVHLKKKCRDSGVTEIDLMGDLIELLSGILKENPVCKPGLYHDLNIDYFRRAAAIDFTISHDDGLNPDGLPKADIVLTAVSRVGKTPISIYLSTLGWKVANIPLVPGSEPPEELFRIERGRVFGLIIDTERIMTHRNLRSKSLGTPGMTSYSSLSGVFEEMEYARDIFKKGGFTVIDVTDKPVETIAEEIVNHVVRRFQKKARR